MDFYLVTLMSTLCILLGMSLHSVAKPLEGSRPASSTRRPGGLPGGCVRHLHHRIERCLTRYEQLLVTYRAESTDQEQRDRLRPSFCHQYQVTLQCLHEVLMECPAQPEHLNLIEVRLGYLRTYMHLTCNAPQQNNTPRPTTLPTVPTRRTSTRPTTTTGKPTSTSSQTSTTTPTSTPKPTSAPKSTRITTSTASEATLRPTFKSTNGKMPESTPVAGEPDLRELENNSVKGYTVNYRHASASSSVPPPGVKPTSYSKTKLQLLFARHGRKTGLGVTGENIHSKGDGNSLVPVMIITEDGTSKSVVQAHVSGNIDCTVDEKGKIDVRCMFSGARGLTWSYLSTLLTLTLILQQLLR